MFTALLIGFVLGFVFSVPIAGPISALVFNRGLGDRARSAVYLAMGAALAEGVYAYLAFWGFTKLLAMHPWIQPISKALTAVLLLGLGIHFASKKKPALSVAAPAKKEPSLGHKRSFFLGIMITALNPTLMVTWGGAVATLHSLELVAFDSTRALPFSIGVCCGISTWFTVLLTVLRRYRERLNRSKLDRTVRFTGVLLVLLGLFFAVRFAMSLRTLV